MSGTEQAFREMDDRVEALRNVLAAAKQRIDTLERERDAAITAEQHRLIEAVKRYDPLTSTHCGDWEQSDMIAHGVHKSIIEVLRKSVQAKKLAAHRAARQSGTGNG